MSSGGDSVRRLQDADTRIAHLRAQLAAVTESLQRDPELDRRRSSAATARAEREHADADAAAAEAEMEALATRVRALDRRLYGGSVHNPHELLEMQHELEALRHQLSEAESRALELLDQAERTSREAAATDEQLALGEARRAGELEPLRGHAEDLGAEMNATIAERERLAAAVEPRDLALYTRVAARRQPAVVPLQGDACGGCHLPLSIEERRLVRTAGALVQCSNCDRILVA